MMGISTINYCEIIFKHPNLSKIMVLPTYETPNLLQNEIKSNAMAVNSNLRGRERGYIRLLVSPTSYTLLTNKSFFCQFHTVHIIIYIAGTCHAQEELKFQYDKNLQVSHKTRGVERALIQKLVLAVEVRYTTSMRKRITGQFTGNLFILIKYLIDTYGKISPIQMIYLEHNTKSMQYDPQNPVVTVFNQVEDLQ